MLPFQRSSSKLHLEPADGKKNKKRFCEHHSSSLVFGPFGPTLPRSLRRKPRDDTTHGTLALKCFE